MNHAKIPNLSWIIFRFNHPLKDGYLFHSTRKWRNNYLLKNGDNRVTFEIAKFGRGLGVRKVKNRGAGCKSTCKKLVRRRHWRRRSVVGGREGERPAARGTSQRDRASIFFLLYVLVSFSLSSSLPGPHPVHPSPSILWTRTFFFLSVSFLLAAAAAADAQPVLHRRIDPIECVSEERGWF